MSTEVSIKELFKFRLVDPVAEATRVERERCLAAVDAEEDAALEEIFDRYFSHRGSFLELTDSPTGRAIKWIAVEAIRNAKAAIRARIIGSGSTRPQLDAPATGEAVADLVAKLSSLTEEQRLDVISVFCSHCGGDRPCSCWNDE